MLSKRVTFEYYSVHSGASTTYRPHRFPQPLETITSDCIKRKYLSSPFLVISLNSVLSVAQPQFLRSAYLHRFPQPLETITSDCIKCKCLSSPFLVISFELSLSVSQLQFLQSTYLQCRTKWAQPRSMMHCALTKHTRTSRYVYL